MKDNITPFEQNVEFYLSYATECLKVDDFAQAIVNLKKALLIAPKTKKAHILLSIADLCAKMQFVELASYYYFLCLSQNSSQTEGFAYVGLANLCLAKGDQMLAKYYFNLATNCAKIDSFDNFDDLIKQQVEQSITPKNFEEYNQIVPVLEDIKKLFQKGDFDSAIEVLEKLGDKENPTIRSNLANAYFLQNQVQKGRDLLENFGEDNPIDLANLMLNYYACMEESNFFDVKNKLLQQQNFLQGAQLFVVAMAFVQVEDFENAQVFLDKFFEENIADVEYNFIYAMVLINNKRFDEAKKILLVLNKFDHFDSFVIDHYLKICDEKRAKKVECAFVLPVSQFVLAREKLKNFALLRGESLKKAFLQNKDLFYYSAKLRSLGCRDELFDNLAQLRGKQIDEFFEYLLLTPNCSNNLKNAVAVRRAFWAHCKQVCVEKDGVFSKYIFPKLDKTFQINSVFSRAFAETFKFFLKILSEESVNFCKIFNIFENFECLSAEPTEVVAANMVWALIGKQHKVKLNEVCKYFHITNEQFFNFANCHNLEDV